MRALFRVQLGPRYTGWANTKGRGAVMCLLDLLGQLRSISFLSISSSELQFSLCHLSSSTVLTFTNLL